LVEKSIETLVGEAATYHASKDYAQELEIWREASKVRHGNPYIEHNIALALANNGQFGEALALFDDLARKYPRLSRVHNNRGTLLMRMGVELQFLIPVFREALVTSEDIPEFLRYLSNLCGCIAYGLDAGASEALSAVEQILPEVLRKLSPQEFLQKNIEFTSRLLAVYRTVNAYRQAFARGEWRLAEEAIDRVVREFKEMGLDNFARGMDGQVRRFFTLTRHIVGVVETIGTDPGVSVEKALQKFECLIVETKSLETEERKSFHTRLLDILTWFVTGMIHSLQFLANPSVEYREDTLAMSTVARLGSVSYVDLSSVLGSLLRFVDRQARELDSASRSIASLEGRIALRDKLWAKVSLFCNGLAFDYKEVDTALAHGMLGWEQNPLEDARAKILGFKSLVERQTHKDVIVNGRPQENIARALLQSFLTSRTYREVPVRAGKTDILEFVRGGRFLYETKIWRGTHYYISGLREIEEYIAGEEDGPDLMGVFYVLFDPTKRRQAAKHLGGDLSKTTIGGRNVEVIVVNIWLPIPSNK